MRSDEFMKIFRWTYETRHIACVLCGFQLLVTLLSLAQHIYSLTVFHHIFRCEFYISTANTNTNNISLGTNKGEVSRFLQADFVIYDLGLYHYIWNIDKCIANYMDGGYMRALWCLGYIGAAGLTFIAAVIRRPHPYILYPIIIQQSTFCIGVLILTFSALPKLMRIILLDLDGKKFGMIGAFLFGAILNYVLTYTVWHFHWHIETIRKQDNGESLQVRLVAAAEDHHASTGGAGSLRAKADQTTGP